MNRFINSQEEILKKLLSRSKQLGKDKKGTTLVETIVTLLLISIMMTMAAGALSSASKIFVRVQKTQYAQSIMDTVMTELRDITKDAAGYVKIYGATGTIVNTRGAKSGTALEFLTPEGYVELVSTNGCNETQIYIGDKVSGTADAVQKGRLLTRYYFRNSDTGKYVYQKGTQDVARGAAKVFGDGFYMGNYVEVYYTLPEGAKNGSKINSVTAKVTVFTDYDAYGQPSNVVATDTEILEFRNPLIVKSSDDSSITATNE